VILTVSTTHSPATDLGYLLHKHPERVQAFQQSFGTATVFYPEASSERTTAALTLEIDPVALARSRGKGAPDFSLGQYVNDRSYAASSLLAVAMADVFSTARAGVCKARPELADSAIPLEIRIPAMPCRGGVEIARRVFEPLGWSVSAHAIALDPAYPQWGDSRYLDLALSGEVRLADALSQLYVLLPVLDESKHYWQGPDEVDKLLRSGEGWLTDHPERALIARRYLGRGSGLTRMALTRLAELDGSEDEPTPEEETAQPEERRTPLNTQRHEAVHAGLTELGARSVIDLGCGPGQFLARLIRDRSFTKVTGCDVSTRSLRLASRRLHLDRLSEREAERVSLFQSALTYEDERMLGYDAAVLMEVIEHVDLPRLSALERVVFGVTRPKAVLVTTPNVEYNTLYELSGARHSDHRFEWTRAEFAAWSEAVASAYDYRVERRGIGDLDDTHGTPTQMAVFTR